MIARHLLCADTATAALDQPAPAGTQVLAGSPQCRTRTLHQHGDIEVGLWQMTEGTVVDVEVDEVFAVLEGRGAITFSDGERVALRPGIVVRLYGGERVAWRVERSLRKLYLAL
jgi:uncharacterized cupin superfamily protein